MDKNACPKGKGVSSTDLKKNAMLCQRKILSDMTNKPYFGDGLAPGDHDNRKISSVAMSNEDNAKLLKEYNILLKVLAERNRQNRQLVQAYSNMRESSLRDLCCLKLLNFIASDLNLVKRFLNLIKCLTPKDGVTEVKAEVNAEIKEKVKTEVKAKVKAKVKVKVKAKVAEEIKAEVKEVKEEIKDIKDVFDFKYEPKDDFFKYEVKDEIERSLLAALHVVGKKAQEIITRRSLLAALLAVGEKTQEIITRRSLRRPAKRKRARVLEPLKGGPSKWNDLNDEEQLCGGDGDGDGSFDAFGDRSPKTRRKRDPSAKAAGWMQDRRLIEIVKFNSTFIPHAVKNLVKQYEADPRSAMVDILEMLFEACGAKFKLDVESIDAIDVDNVVVKLVQLAVAGFVEDNYSSKRKELRSFKKNLASFWNTLVLECQNGSLFDNLLFLDKCMDYVIALSCSPPRVYRRVATLVGLQLISSLITVAKKLVNQRKTTQRQLNAADKKKHNDGSRVESLSKKLSQTHKMISTIEEMMKKLFQGIFWGGYRDVLLPDIRACCIKYLGIWIISYPSMFLQNIYLKYLGWVLYDNVAAVRKTSVVALQKLYKVDCNVPLLDLFTERFCKRMTQLAYDNDVSVAASAIGLFTPLLRHQLLILTAEEFRSLHELMLTHESPVIRRAIAAIKVPLQIVRLRF